MSPRKQTNAEILRQLNFCRSARMYLAERKGWLEKIEVSFFQKNTQLPEGMINLENFSKS